VLPAAIGLFSRRRSPRTVRYAAAEPS
jgi:hypothetical protein